MTHGRAASARSVEVSFRQAAQLYNLTFRWPDIMQARCAPLWFRHAGEPALPRLLDLMTRQLGCKVVGEAFMNGLAELGRHALPAVPALDQLIDRRRRIPENEPSRDAEMETDERLLAAAREARYRILTDAQISRFAQVEPHRGFHDPGAQDLVPRDAKDQRTEARTFPTTPEPPVAHSDG
ncbi:hypothetical protein [Streptomyces sp. NPDC058572]|uniref:hypothetical protein n=1 Tax=Streptomyces sp. NPDC058572 TaxID=3346546 RepID=UPI0036631506